MIIWCESRDISKYMAEKRWKILKTKMKNFEKYWKDLKKVKIVMKSNVKTGVMLKKWTVPEEKKSEKF